MGPTWSDVAVQDGPAARAGVIAGDQLISIDGWKLSGPLVVLQKSKRVQTLAVSPAVRFADAMPKALVLHLLRCAKDEDRRRRWVEAQKPQAPPSLHLLDPEALPQLDDAQLEEAIMEDIPLEEPAAPSKERAADEDDAPLISMMPASIAPKEAEEGLPSFAAAAKESKRKEDDDDQPLITGATLGKRPVLWLKAPCGSSLAAFELLAHSREAVALVGADQGVAGVERGCVAVEDIRADELLLEIPVSCCLSVVPGSYDEIFDEELAKATEVAGLRRQDLELAIAVAVERELGEESAWWSYLKLLDCSLHALVQISVSSG
eukprot:Skav201028  [mRNA]  locus=scaffold3386:89204:99405:+ [translate_table: standard]